MRSFAGEFTVPGNARDAYDFMLDPHRLVKCLPDVKDYQVADADHFDVTLRVGFGRVRGPMSMQMEILDKVEGSHARIAGKGSMLKSGVHVDGSFNLAEAADGATHVSWSGTAKIGAYLMQLVGGMFEGLVQENLEHFVRTMEAELKEMVPAKGEVL